MTQVVTPSQKTITKGQAGKFIDVAVDALVKSGLPSEATQQVLEQHGAALADEFVASIRRRVEAISDLVVRRVKVDRARDPRSTLAATNRRHYVDNNVVDGMPRGEGDEVEVVFFKIGRYVSDVDLEHEYELRGLKPADPYSLAAVNEADPAFADDHPNSTHWKDGRGRWCYAAFYRWDDERDVRVNRIDSGWNDYWWFAGLRK